MKTLVAYYSRTGNNRSLATRLARDCGADLIELVPRVRAFPVQVLFSLLRWPLGLSRASRRVDGYDRVVVCGPLWMGRLCLPALDFLRFAKKRGIPVHVVTCCGSTDSTKDDPYGYARVFAELRSTVGRNLGWTEALPLELAVPPAQRGVPETVAAIRLGDETFVGSLLERYQGVVSRLN